MSTDKTLSRLLGGASDTAFGFDELCLLLERFGFEKRTKGSHHIFRRQGVEEMINLQRDGGAAKPYQIRQVRAILLKNRIVGVK